MRKRLVCDLHSHSGYSGGVGRMNLPELLAAMGRKGIDVFGAGDALHPAWYSTLQRELVPACPGLWALPGFETTLMLQTEVVFTYPYPRGGRKSFHQVILFPSFSVVAKVAKRMESWGVKNTVGRPFVRCETVEQLRERVVEIAKVHEAIEQFPAHVMTPEGVLGSKHPVDSLVQVFGDALECIHAVETGLSADPDVLSLIPELDGFTLLSNSDCHSSRLDRLGREYTEFSVEEKSYAGIVRAIREHRVERTVEMNPMEGKYYSTGHRGDKMRHEGRCCRFGVDEAPELCPICGKPLTVGVAQRARDLSRIQGADRRPGKAAAKHPPFVHAVPLVEVIALALGLKNPLGTRVLKTYSTVLDILGDEARLWRMSAAEARDVLGGALDERVVQAIDRIKTRRYSMEPGYDGVYGVLSW